MCPAMSSSPLPLPFSTTTTTIISHTHHRSMLPNAAAPPKISNQQSYLSLDTPLKDRISPTKPKTIRFRLSELCRQGHLILARQLFDTIPQPTTVLWNTLIIGYVCNNMPHEAISLYSRLLWNNCSSTKIQTCDPYTYSSVLKACAETKKLLIGKALHSHILRSNIYPSRIVYNSLLNMYSTCLLSSVYSSESDLVKTVFRTMCKRNVVSWNTMVSWYTKTSRFEEAVSHFVMMMRMGFRPTVVSFVNVFPAITGLRNIEIANMVNGLMMKLGEGRVKDLFVVSSAITMYSELGCIDFARKIFDNSSEKNAHVWNAMIGGYVQNNCPLIALELFCNALEEDGLNTDDVTLLLALSAASQLQILEIVHQLHAYLIKIMCSSVILLNAVISLYSRCNLIGDSFKIFSEMQERDVVSWNTMISALVHNELNDEGLMLVYEMQNQGFSIDDVTITALLSAASNLKDPQIGKQTHSYLIRHGILFNGMESYLIDMYAKSGFIQAAETIFNMNLNRNRDQAIWNAMISGNVQNGLIEQSFIIFQQMLKQSVMPNAITLASILPAISQSGNISLGKILHSFAIRNFMEENIFVSSALIDMYSKSGAIVYAERVFLKSIEKNSVTYTNMILGYGQHGMGEKAILLFHSMKESGINPDNVTLVAVLSACSYTGLVNEGLEIFESMEIEYGIKPSTEHYSCVVDMLGRVGRISEAYDFAKKLGREGNVLRIWGSLFAACKIHGNFELGKSIANKLLEMEKADMNTGYHVLLSNIYAEEGDWEYVKSVRNEMVEKGLMKEVGGSWINVSGHSNFFMSKDKKYPQCVEIYPVLKHLLANMKDANFTPHYLLIE